MLHHIKQQFKKFTLFYILIMCIICLRRVLYPYACLNLTLKDIKFDKVINNILIGRLENQC